MKPMTKEEWDARQSIIRKVVDPETGRTRWGALGLTCTAGSGRRCEEPGRAGVLLPEKGQMWAKIPSLRVSSCRGWKGLEEAFQRAVVGGAEAGKVEPSSAAFIRESG